MKLISFGKKFENLSLSIEHEVLGSEFRTFSNKIRLGDKVVLVCASQMWGIAEVSSGVEYDAAPIWKDKLYPYRAKIHKIKVFECPISFSESGIDQIFRKRLGIQWAYKVLFTPGELPVEAIECLETLLASVRFLDDSSYHVYLSENVKKFEVARRIRLGLN